MKAIQTRFIGPTNFKGARIKAWAEGWGSVTISYRHDLSSCAAHYQAALALMEKVNRGKEYPLDPPTNYGSLQNGDYVFCFAGSVIA